jgi:DNA polymerase-3 subunit gamma/tau
MMKLMSDLISYLRDLLVGKVKPDALADDLNPELQKSLEAQAAMIETDRLLELIDQFAAAEGRMKWAPNKRLHFEVAVIKAIQTLSQVTLNEVIANLTALREGKSGAQAIAPRSAPKPPVKNVAPATPPPRKVEVPRVAEQAQSFETAEIRESPPVLTTAESANLDPEAIWQKAVEQIRTTRPLIRVWVESAKALGIEGRFLVLGFPPEQKMAMESLATPRTRDFLEGLIREISGQDLKIKSVLKEGLPVAAFVEPSAAPVDLPVKKADSQAMFKDDPLIREALEIFKGEIKTASD